MAIQLQAHKGLTITGYSRAAHRTGLEVGGLGILLDGGLDVQKAFHHVFITHQHLDHCIFLPQYTMNFNSPDEQMKVISHETILNKIEPYLVSALRMSKNIPMTTIAKDILTANQTEFIPIKYKESYTFTHGTSKWSVELIECIHGVMSVGFGFSIHKNKLKEEYKQLSQKEIITMKNNSIEITEPKIEKIFLFLGDTDKHILLNNNIYQYPTIIIECTYIYDDEVNLSVTNKHIHWNDIKNTVIYNHEIQFILIHFSVKYKKEEVIKFFNEEKRINQIQNLFILI